MLKALFTDIDGTLFTSELTISEKTRKAIRKAHDMGVLIVLSSGRYITGMRRAQEQLDLPVYVRHEPQKAVEGLLDPCLRHEFQRHARQQRPQQASGHGQAKHAGSVVFQFGVLSAVEPVIYLASVHLRDVCFHRAAGHAPPFVAP